LASAAATIEAFRRGATAFTAASSAPEDEGRADEAVANIAADSAGVR
jgi:hypothetical protein